MTLNCLENDLTANSEINNIAQFDLHLHLENRLSCKLESSEKLKSTLAVYNYLFLPLIILHFSRSRIIKVPS
jgi:hypothetical protein